MRALETFPQVVRRSEAWRKSVAVVVLCAAMTSAALELSSEAVATTYAVRSIPEAAEVSKRVVWVRCLSVHVEKSRAGGLWTYWKFEPLRIVKGQFAEHTFTLRMFGGSLGNLTITGPDVPHFVAGDEGVLFLGADSPQGYALMGMYFDIRVHPKTGRKWVMPGEGNIGPSNGLPLFRASDGAAYEVAPLAVPLDDFLYSIERALTE